MNNRYARSTRQVRTERDPLLRGYLRTDASAAHAKYSYSYIFCVKDAENIRTMQNIMILERKEGKGEVDSFARLVLECAVKNVSRRSI